MIARLPDAMLSGHVPSVSVSGITIRHAGESGELPQLLDSTSSDPDRTPRFVSAFRLPNVSTLWGGTGPSDHTGCDNSPDGVDSSPCVVSLASTGGRICAETLVPAPCLPGHLRLVLRERSGLVRAGARGEVVDRDLECALMYH